MRKTIMLNGQKIDYRLRRNRRARRISLCVNCDATVTATLPYYAPFYALELFLREHAEWLEDKIEWFKTHQTEQIRLKGSHQEYLVNKSRALRFARSKLEQYAPDYGVTYNNITIRNQSSRWGSCSQSGTISFNYKIALLPPHLAEYIVVHELCHLREMNHSHRFWNLVGKTVPDYNQRRRELRHIKIL